MKNSIEVDLKLIKEYGINPAITLAVLQKKDHELIKNEDGYFPYSEKEMTEDLDIKYAAQSKALETLEKSLFIKRKSFGLPLTRHFKLLSEEERQSLLDQKEEKSTFSKLKMVYLLKCGDRYKIGIANDIERRIKELNERPYPVELLYYTRPIKNAHELESKLYQKYENKRLGGEWFNLDSDDILFISQLFEIS